MLGLQHILINPFVKATRRSASRAATLGVYTDNMLARPGQSGAIQALYAAYHPVWEAFESVYAGKSYRLCQQMGSVAGMQETLAELSDKIKVWAVAIEVVYAKGTPDYNGLLPRGRSAFRDGKKVACIAAVKSLAQALADYPALSGIQEEVAAFAASLEALETEANDKKGAKKRGSTSLQRAHAALCSALYAVLGGLINLYPDEPERVSVYFDEATMHRHHYRKGKPKEAS